MHLSQLFLLENLEKINETIVRLSEFIDKSEDGAVLKSNAGRVSFPQLQRRLEKDSLFSPNSKIRIGLTPQQLHIGGRPKPRGEF